jgi:hypothetical protein
MDDSTKANQKDVSSAVIRLLADTASSGRPVFEEVRAEPLDARKYRVLASPGLVQGIAADDEIELLPDGQFRVLRRGRNVCVQIFSRTNIREVERAVTDALRTLGGRLDGSSSKQVVYTVPLRSGFSPIESALNALRERLVDYEWYYGNVYDPKDGVTPLNWWLD